MKFNNYETPEVEIVTVSTEDVITTSVGDTPSIDWGW